MLNQNKHNALGATCLCKCSHLELASVIEQAWLSLTGLHSPEQVFLWRGTIYKA